MKPIIILILEFLLTNVETYGYQISHNQLLNLIYQMVIFVFFSVTHVKCLQSKIYDDPTLDFFKRSPIWNRYPISNKESNLAFLLIFVLFLILYYDSY